MSLTYAHQHISTMSRYNAEFPFPVAYPPQAMTNVLAEWLSKEDIKQIHVAGRYLPSFTTSLVSHVRFLETEKYAHVTFFFNGGVEKQFAAEERAMIPSPKVATYDKEPKMSVQGVADKVAELVKKGEYEFVMCNFAPPDMVGHSPLLSLCAHPVYFSLPVCRSATPASSTPQ